MNIIKELRIQDPQTKRAILQHIMAWFLPLITLGGLIWPRLGLIAAVMMFTSLLIATQKGRFWCGWICPRGSFLDRWLALISLNRPMPKIFAKKTFRWSVFTILMSILFYRLMSVNHTFDAVGGIFVMLCLVTTMVAISLGMAYKPRTWCTFCPMGTLQGALGNTFKKS